MSDPSRRAMIAGAAGAVALVGAVPTAATGAIAGPSSELTAWRAARAVYDSAVEAVAIAQDNWISCHSQFASYLDVLERVSRRERDAQVFMDGHMMTMCDEPEMLALYNADREADAAEQRAMDAVLKRPVRSWRDVAEIADLLRSRRGWHPGSEQYQDDIACPELDALFAAINTMGGANA